VHAACVFRLFLYFDGFDVRAFVLIFDLVDLVLEELVVVALLVVDDAADEEERLEYDAFD
jgi:hypothetical protein